MYDEAEAARAYGEDREGAYDEDDTTSSGSEEDSASAESDAEGQSGSDSDEGYTYGNRTGDLLARHLENTDPDDDPMQTAVETILGDAWDTYNASGSEEESGSSDSESEEDSGSSESEW